MHRLAYWIFAQDERRNEIINHLWRDLEVSGCPLKPFQVFWRHETFSQALFICLSNIETQRH